MKKIGILLTIIIMAMLFAVSASAATEGYYTYEVENGKAEITDVDTSISGDVTIPSTLGGYSVTSIGNEAFLNCNDIKTISIPSNVTYINPDAFYFCSRLQNITVDINNVAYSSDERGVLFNKDKTIIIQYPIGNENFSYVIPNSVISIEHCAFIFCWNLEEITIPDSVTSIGSNAFRCCDKLTSITIPDSVTSIGVSAFSESSRLLAITVDSDNVAFSNDERGVLFNKDKTVLIQYPLGNPNESYTIPNGVTSLERTSFTLCTNLKNITFPNSVTIIDNDAFYYCPKLTSIIIPDSVTFIGTFTNCDSFEDVYYCGTETQWNNIRIWSAVINNANIHYNYCPNSSTNTHSYASVVTTPATHFTEGIKTYTCECSRTYTEIIEKIPHSYNKIVTAPTCTEQGYATYSCQCGYSYIADYVKANGHSYTSEITKEPTHKETGVKTFTCACGNTYTVDLAIIPHAYSEAVTAPTCTEQGYTTYTCECGDSYVDDYVKANGHSHTSEITKEPTHKETGVKTFTCACGNTYTVDLAIIPHAYSEAVTAPTCTEQGYTTYTCECGDTYVDNYVTENGHSHTSEITTQPTHLAEGVKTFTCECGDTYTEAIAKTTEHTYTPEITTQPTHLAEGVTTYTCECGDKYEKPIAKTTEHTYTSEVTKEPTHKEEGVKTFTCECGDSYTEPVAKIAHVYNKAVTAPTCTEDGYTTYTCECGDSYKGDIVNKTGHNHTSVVTRPATHLLEGIRTYTCTVCSHSYADAIAKTTDHSYAVSKVVKPTCEDKGYTVYACECGSTKNDNYTDKTGHNYKGQTCTKCGEKCSCNCHKSGFMGFIWKITLFFSKLFKTKKMCACGIAHY